MVLDFTKLAAKGSISGITEPAKLFDALPNKSAGYGYLRTVQGDVLNAWSPRRNERDLVVKTNTGGGKTVVGLMMLQCGLNEGKGPALYLAPDPHLASRVIEEGNNLGLSVVNDPENPKFISGEAICVTTMATLINGKTRFGLRGTGTRTPLAVHSIVVDDAHAALTQIEERTRLRIPATHSAFQELLDLFGEELRIQGLNAYMDIAENDSASNATLRVPFWSWRTKQEDVLRIIRPHRTSPELEWQWPLVSDLLPICEAVFTAEAFEVMPPCPPIEMIPSFAEAERRVYLTATLADDSVLVTNFDADPASIAQALVPSSASDLGDRLVLAPQELNPDISHDDLRSLAREIADERNVVVLVPSHFQARRWFDEQDLTVSKAVEIDDAVEKLKAGHVGLVVIVNRYDGIDLPDDACRVLIIDSLPFAYTGSERREAVALKDSEALVARQLQRLEQGMGRAVRSRDDRCAVLLIGAKLTQLVARVDVADRLSPATRAQLRLSRIVAGELEHADISELRSVIDQVVNGDSGFRTASREALLGVSYDPSNISPVAPWLRAAYNAAISGQYQKAADAAREAVQAAVDVGDTRLAGWLGETYAMYVQAVDPAQAQKVLAVAHSRNHAVLRPLEGVGYERISLSSTQARTAVEYLTSTYSSGAELVIGFDAILSDLAWDNSRTEQAEDALASVGLHLGFAAQQPERNYGIGSDVLWALGNHSYAVIEAKTGASAEKIWKKDINQLNGSVTWCQTEYGSDATVLPVMIHPSRSVERTGTPPVGCQVITTKKLKALKAAIRDFARTLAYDDGYRDVARAQETLETMKLNIEQLFSEFAEKAVRESK
ncbi:helicase C-terminal domain-containing protein [Rhodococcus globerulus]|uniref:helicase C-terminal domain-containing protein n=1 Tax=Rhodococcus globerulus TaxID=33008 RepID=UPI001C579428|nr:helicase C-terminal domain-containing protein [Rhodococcus globerulus]QXW02608.1 DEAD/DEAH box helicase [Rhodococcus globerulus]